MAGIHYHGWRMEIKQKKKKKDFEKNEEKMLNVDIKKSSMIYFIQVKRTE